MQNRFNLLDPQAEDSLFDIESMRRFAGIELPGHDIRDKSTCGFNKVRYRGLAKNTARLFTPLHW